jgi:hypothetical protein
MHVTNQCAPWKFASDAGNLVLQVLKFYSDVYVPQILKRDSHNSLNL